jgi:hypothetical protein
MQIINVQLLIELYLFINAYSMKENSRFRILTESDLPNSKNSSEPTNSGSRSNSCLNFRDCFNCTLNPTCRWSWDNEECTPFESNNINYSLPVINDFINNNISIVNNHINFLRKVCYMPVNPYIDNNNNSFLYNKISEKYCGPHYIVVTEEQLENNKNFRIAINNITGVYGTPNLLCEYIFLSGPQKFDVNIKINAQEINNFYLLFSEDSLNFLKNINDSTSLSINIGNQGLNAFIFYGLKSFNSSPFIITYKEKNILQKATQYTGYIMIAVFAFIIPLIIFSIVYLRRKSKIFKYGSEESIPIDESGKIQYIKKTKSVKFGPKVKKNRIVSPVLPGFVSSFSPPSTKTPDRLINGQAFVFEDICCYDKEVIINKKEIKRAKCGHVYHANCYNELLEEKKNNNEIFRCFSCHKIIYP